MDVVQELRTILDSSVPGGVKRGPGKSEVKKKPEAVVPIVTPANAVEWYADILESSSQTRRRERGDNQEILGGKETRADCAIVLGVQSANSQAGRFEGVKATLEGLEISSSGQSLQWRYVFAKGIGLLGFTEWIGLVAECEQKMFAQAIPLSRCRERLEHPGCTSVGCNGKNGPTVLVQAADSRNRTFSHSQSKQPGQSSRIMLVRRSGPLYGQPSMGIISTSRTVGSYRSGVAGKLSHLTERKYSQGPLRLR